MYEQLIAKLELYEKLSIAEAQAAGGENTIPHHVLMEELKNKYR